MEMQSEVSRRIAEVSQTGSTVLDLRDCHLSSIPEDIFTLRHLTHLLLGGRKKHFGPQNHDYTNNISTIPSAIIKLDQLQELELSGNRLERLPKEFRELENLQTLDLSGNRLGSLPREIIYLSNLQTLDLSHNKLEQLPKGIGALSNLQTLDLNYNGLMRFPDEIAGLHNLRILRLSGDKLEQLTKRIGELSNLQTLNLGHNKLTRLPKEIIHLSNLQTLDLGDNGLEQLPKEIIYLSNLQTLDLGHNKLTRLPKEILQLKQLKQLIMIANPIIDPPPEIVRAGVEAIFNYFTEVAHTDAVDHLFEAKLLLVGEGRVGKTSVRKSLSIPNYELEDEQTTEGIDIQQWCIPYSETSLDQDFYLNIWDFGGQEIYHATHQFFLTKRSLYLLVTESRKEDRHEDFYYWLNIVRILGENSPVILVQNKCDQPTKALPIREYQEAFTSLTDVVNQPLVVSCKSSHRDTIASLKRAIIRILTDKTLLSHVGTSLPKVWVDVRKALKNLLAQGKDYISYDGYEALCEQHGMDKDRAAFLSDYFHDLGVFLHFREDLQLADTVFLNHEWVTQGVYKVLDHQRVIRQGGEFSTFDLRDIWSDARYTEKRRELVALMKRFELCYELADGKYLAPQLLPVDEVPDLWRLWRDHTNNLRFEFQYKFMPKGILTRFIVKRHQDIYQRTHWRYGVLLDFDNTRAMIRERYFERKITVQLEGENKRGFLEVIRKTLHEIHNSFNNLQVEEMLSCNCPKCLSSTSPYFHKYGSLKRYAANGRKTITCDNSLEDVRILDLIDATFDPDSSDPDSVNPGPVYNYFYFMADVSVAAIGHRPQGIAL